MTLDGPKAWSALRPGETTTDRPISADATVQFIGTIGAPWASAQDCPKQGDEAGGPICFIELVPHLAPALSGLRPGARLQLLYWLHLARRDLLMQSPRSDGNLQGTFALRTPLRPNPIASSLVRLIDIDGPLLSVRGLDCVDGTPLLDIKPEFGHLTGVAA